MFNTCRNSTNWHPRTVIPRASCKEIMVLCLEKKLLRRPVDKTPVLITPYVWAQFDQVGSRRWEPEDCCENRSSGQNARLGHFAGGARRNGKQLILLRGRAVDSGQYAVDFLARPGQ